MNNLTNRVVYITGGSRGIGYGIAKILLDNGMRVAITSRTIGTVKAGVEALKKSKGYIITIASLAGTNFFENGAAYNASKFGLVGFTQAIMLDLRKYGIKVSTIMPGSVATHFNNHSPGDADAWKIQPEDIGQIVLNILSMD